MRVFRGMAYEAMKRAITHALLYSGMYRHYDKYCNDKAVRRCGDDYKLMLQRDLREQGWLYLGMRSVPPPSKCKVRLVGIDVMNEETGRCETYRFQVDDMGFPLFEVRPILVNSWQGSR